MVLPTTDTMHHLFLFAAFLLFLSSALPAQAGKLSKRNERAMAQAEVRMAELVTTIYTDSSETARFTACRDLIRELVEALDRPNSFNYDFPDMPGLSIQYPADRSFRVFTWELFIARDDYRHYGAIQRNEKELVLSPLLDRGFAWTENPENAIVGADNWLGYVVYDIREGGTYRGQPYYLLFGYDSYEGYRRRKILDVLRFEAGSGDPYFGLPVFDTYGEAELLLTDRARIILQYGAEATTALRYDDEFGGVVYENLVMMPGNEGEGPVHLPDGSYHFLRRGEDGRWREEEKIFDHTYEKAPHEVPRPGEGLDLLGRPVKKKSGGNR